MDDATPPTQSQKKNPNPVRREEMRGGGEMKGQKGLVYLFAVVCAFEDVVRVQ